MKRQCNILILGGNGFIGSNLARTLNSHPEYAVTSFDRVEPSVRCPGVEYLMGDFFDDRQLLPLAERYDVVYHCVSTITPGNSNTEYMRGYAGDLLQSVRLCDAIQRAGNRLIFLSSGGTVYGRQAKMPVPEDAPCQPINHYGTIKHCIESIMRSFRLQQNARMIIARLSNPYGPGQDFRKGVGVIDAVIRNALNRTPMTVWGDGEVIRDYLYIDDACGMLAALADYEGPEEVFNLSSGEGHSVNEIIRFVKGRYPDLEVVYTPARSVDLKEIVLDNTRIRKVYTRELLSLREGIDRYLTWSEERRNQA